MLGTSVRTVPHCTRLLCQSSSTFLRRMLSPASLDWTRTKPLAQLAERQDSETLCGSAREDFHSNFSTILGLACYASCLENFHNNTCAQERHSPSTEWLPPCCSHPHHSKMFCKGCVQTLDIWCRWSVGSVPVCIKGLQRCWRCSSYSSKFDHTTLRES